METLIIALFILMFIGTYITAKLDSNIGRIIYYGSAIICLLVLLMTG